MKIILTGGGTGGPVVPLLAVERFIKSRHPQAEFMFIGTAHGPERELVPAHDPSIRFTSVPSGKLRRYFSLRNFAAPFETIAGFVKSIFLILWFKPDVVVGAGGYVSVPVVAAAWVLRKKIAIHQQDVLPSLTNELLAPLADKVTVTFESSVKDFYSGSGLTSASFTKVVWTGNPVLAAVTHERTDGEKNALRRSFGFAPDTDSLPLVLITGGGTGALGLNSVVAGALPELAKFCCVIQIAGKDRGAGEASEPRYASREFATNMPDILAAAAAVVSRAGLSTIAELSALGMPSAIVPMPGSHQEANSDLLQRAHAAVVLPEQTLTAAELTSTVRSLLEDSALRQELSDNIHSLMPHDSTRRVAEVIISLCKK